MSVMTEESAGATAIRPFTIEISEAAIEALRAHVAATRRPEEIVAVADAPPLGEYGAWTEVIVVQLVRSLAVLPFSSSGKL